MIFPLVLREFFLGIIPSLPRLAFCSFSVYLCLETSYYKSGQNTDTNQKWRNICGLQIPGKIIRYWIRPTAKSSSSGAAISSSVRTRRSYGKRPAARSGKSPTRTTTAAKRAAASGSSSICPKSGRSTTGTSLSGSSLSTSSIQVCFPSRPSTGTGFPGSSVKRFLPAERSKCSISSPTQAARQLPLLKQARRSPTSTQQREWSHGRARTLPSRDSRTRRSAGSSMTAANS